MMKLSAITFEHVNDNISANARLEYVDPIDVYTLPLYIIIYKSSSPELYNFLAECIKKYHRIPEIGNKRYETSKDMPYYLLLLRVFQFGKDGKKNVIQEVIKLTPESNDQGFIRDSESGLIKQKTECDSRGYYVKEGYLDGWLPR